MAALKPWSVTTKSRAKPIPSSASQATEIRRGRGGQNTTESARKTVAPNQKQRAGTTTSGSGTEHTRGHGRVISSGDVAGREHQRFGSAGHRRNVHNHYDESHANDDGQDVQFIDVASQENVPAKPSTKCQTVSPRDVLELSQESNYEDVYEVNLHTSKLDTMPNLEKFTNLRLLDLSCNSIKKIENLHHNKGLKELKLYGNEIAGVSNLESLVELHTLQLQHNRIQSVGQCLACLKRLKILRLDSNRLRKLESREIASCSQLTFLDISSNSIDSLKSLNCLSALEELHATHNGLRAVTDLSRCKKLNEVNLAYNRLSDISGLKGLPHITILHLSHNALTTSCLKALGRLRSLQNLDVSHNQLSEVSCIPELFPSLEVLNTSDNQIQRWASVCAFAKCAALSELYLSGNPFSAEDGEKPSYHTDLQRLIPSLDILDGAHVKRNATKSAPMMRPMSAASALSARQVENQLRSVEHDLASFGESLAARFESVRSVMESLPLDPPLSIRSVSTSDGSRPGSRCNSRTRILEAQAFASKNF